MTRPNRQRFSALRSRLSLIILGVAIGLAARWLVSAIGGSSTSPLFEPMPAEVKKDVAESKSP